MTETREWSVPSPVRALLWWPAISFVLVVVFPEATTGVIVGAGAALALSGGLVGAATRRLPRPALTPAVAPPTNTAASDQETTTEIPMEMPTTEIPAVRAASPGRAA